MTSIHTLPLPEKGTFVTDDSGRSVTHLEADLPRMAQFLFDHLDVSESTRNQYSREVIPFLNWIHRTKNPVDPTLLIRWKRHLQRKTDIGSGTKNKYFTVARVLLRELHRWYPKRFPNLVDGVKGFSVSNVHKRSPLTDDDIQKVWMHLESTGDLRAKLIIGLFYFQGLRRVELTRLTVEDFNRDAKTLMVLGKGREDKEPVDLHPKMVAILDKYLRVENLKSGWLLPSTKMKGKSLSSNMIWRIVMNVHRAVGITNNVHSYRKAFTSKLIDAGLNLLDVKQYTRHRDTKMLQVYYDRIDKKKTLPKYYEVF